MATPIDKSLEALREIILRKDKEKLQAFESELEKIRNQITDKEALIASLDPVIADLLERKIQGSKDDMAKALAPVMSAAIKQQIAETKDDVIDALYPIIGKTIRKSIAEAMKNLVASVNQKIELALRNRLSPRRLQARLTGVSEGELMLKDAMPFRVEEIFLIHKETGLMLAHAALKRSQTTVDEQLIGGMLTAIRDFASEAFKTKSGQDLDEILYGDVKIVLEIGRYSYLAAVISGIEPTHFRESLHQLERKIHSRFYRSLRKFDGDITHMGRITRPLRQFLLTNDRTPGAPRPARPYFLYLLGILAFIALTIFAAIKVPGWISHFKKQRAVQQQLNYLPPSERKDIKIRIAEDRVLLTGFVKSMPVRSEIDSLMQALSGLPRIENQIKIRATTATEAEIYRQIQDQLARAPEFNDPALKLIVEADLVIIEGQVPTVERKREIGYRISDIPGVRVVQNNLRVSAATPEPLTQHQEFLRSRTIFFALNADSIQFDQVDNLNAILAYMQNLTGMHLVIRGFSDNIANPEYNLALSRKRAEMVAKYFTAKNFPTERIRIEFFGDKNPIAANDSEAGRAQNRRVEFDILATR